MPPAMPSSSSFILCTLMIPIPVRHALPQIRCDNQRALQLLLGIQDAKGKRVVDLTQVIDTTGHNLLHECAWYDRHECARLLVSMSERRAPIYAMPLLH